MAFGKKFDKSKLKNKRQQQNPLFKRKKILSLHRRWR